MKRALLPLAIGCVLVGVVAIVLAIVGWSWGWFVLANGALAVLLLMLFRGSVTGADPDRPPGVARVSAARAAGPFDPETLARGRERTRAGSGRCGRGSRRGRGDRVRLPLDRRRAGGRGGARRVDLPLVVVQAFAVVVALLVVAAAGWLLSLAARRILRRHGVPTDERDREDQ